MKGHFEKIGKGLCEFNTLLNEWYFDGNRKMKNNKHMIYVEWIRKGIL